jgi:hypothetical protein
VVVAERVVVEVQFAVGGKEEGVTGVVTPAGVDHAFGPWCSGIWVPRISSLERFWIT